MPALHQNLNTADGRKFVELLIDLLERKHVMILILFRSIKRAELAVNIANVRVIDVSIDDVGDDLASTSGVTFAFAKSRLALASAPTSSSGQRYNSSTSSTEIRAPVSTFSVNLSRFKETIARHFI